MVASRNLFWVEERCIEGAFLARLPILRYITALRRTTLCKRVAHQVDWAVGREVDDASPLPHQNLPLQRRDTCIEFSDHLP
jgi:hypothetical protein